MRKVCVFFLDKLEAIYYEVCSIQLICISIFFMHILQRFAPAATDINGAIYVAGGYDGNAYTK